jgi:CDP-alcohol phosphatidyltransferase 2
LLVTYPYETLALVSIVYLGFIPVSYRRYQQNLRQPAPEMATGPETVTQLGAETPGAGAPAGETKH